MGQDEKVFLDGRKVSIGENELMKWLTYMSADMKDKQSVLLDDNGEATAKKGDLIKWLPCIKCDKYVIAKVINISQDVICPHCKNKFKIKILENGTAYISIR